MKILIIGCVASGKSTLANRLSDKLSISYYEIDSIVHDDINKRLVSNIISLLLLSKCILRHFYKKDI